MKNHHLVTFFSFSYALMSAVQNKHAWDWRSISWRRRTLLWECPYIPIYLISSMISNMYLRLETCPTMTRTRFCGIYRQTCWRGFLRLSSNVRTYGSHIGWCISCPLDFWIPITSIYQFMVDAQYPTQIQTLTLWHSTHSKRSIMKRYCREIMQVTQCATCDWDIKSFPVISIIHCTIAAPICTHGCPHQFMTIQLHIDNQIDFWGKVEYMNISLVR